ncbi:hypothetical protein [uncultured Hymenobacter sp.]|uniref:hypothetical protein n=1 Tax=uncultured Hymenobacter sp. TaxID=170016 RepID=UPI0035CBB6E8
MPAITNADLRELVAQMIGATAWRSRAGSGTGSIFTLEFGLALPANDKQGEFSLMVYCAWRIVMGSKLLCSWHDDSDEVLAPGLAALEGLAVAQTSLSEWNDLSVRFATGHELHIMNDCSPFRDFDSCWDVIYKGQTNYCVNIDSSITQESVTS